MATSKRSHGKRPTGRPNGRPPLSPQSRARVIELYVITGRVDEACRLAGVDRSAHYDWLRDDPGYAAKFLAAEPQAAQTLIDEATRRAVEGVDKPVTVAGKAVKVREYSDRLLEFLIKGRRPEIYGDRFKAELTGKDGDAIQHKVIVEFQGKD
jgi:hypothetical protein